MKRELAALARRYEAALRKHLKAGSRAALHPALSLGRHALALGLETLELAAVTAQLQRGGVARKTGKMACRKTGEHYPRLLNMKTVAWGRKANPMKEIASTQRLVADSVQSINRYALELDAHQPA